MIHACQLTPQNLLLQRVSWVGNIRSGSAWLQHAQWPGCHPQATPILRASTKRDGRGRSSRARTRSREPERLHTEHNTTGLLVIQGAIETPAEDDAPETGADTDKSKMCLVPISVPEAVEEGHNTEYLRRNRMRARGKGMGNIKGHITNMHNAINVKV